MANTRIEKYRKYRQSIANSSDKMPTVKNPANDENFATEAGYFKRIILKRRIENSLIVLLILIVTILLIVFGIKLF